ncbi:MAG: proline--tRNA ligase [Candidatus Aminicenantes bacterium]|nr:proline--tRNA ligase [Candidatus Aminicenantes bacterium]
MKGMMVIRPYGYEIWELLRDQLDRMFKETGHRNAYFPLFIPESFLKKEAEHVEGFAPEVAWVTSGGGEVLEERLAVRPTSEAIICSMYAKWVKSWRDLPLLYNQWANVVRWEKVTRLFLRTTEFLWQEGHTVHATAEEAEAETLQMLGIYRKLAEEYLAIPVLTGRKSDSEKFAGAVRTYAIEMLMPDGKALQAGTSHNLGQNFAKAFNIRYESKEQKLEYAWQTSWGATTRLVGALVMTHGDDSGLILPPRVAPIQAVIVPISAGNWQQTVLPQAQKIFGALKAAGLRVHLDDRDAYTPGWKYADWEMRGVPVRIEIGPKDIEKQQVVLVSRLDRKKSFVSWDSLAGELSMLLERIQGELYNRALAMRDANTRQASTYTELLEVMAGSRGFIRCGWCGSPDCEVKVKADTSATIRVILDEPDPGLKSCVVCAQKALHTVIFAKSY